MGLIAFLWLISPIILLPLYIGAKRKRTRLEEFIRQLLYQNRISPEEYVNKTAQLTPPTEQTQPDASPEGYQLHEDFTAYTPPAYGYIPVDDPAKQYTQDTTAEQPAAVQTEQSFTYTAPKPAPRKKAERNPASALLAIGTALIILAGIVFSKMTWLQMNDWQRTGTIALASVFFFVVSAFAVKKLKLDNTSMAFYMIGSVFASITVLTAGIFGLMGGWLSIDGDGSLMVYAISAGLLTVLSAKGVTLYQKGRFMNAALYSGLCSFTLISMQIISDREWWVFVLNIISAIPLYLLYRNKLQTGSRYDSSFKLFAVILTVIYFMAALPYMIINVADGWNLANMLTAIVWLIQLIIYGSRLNSGKLKCLHSLIAAAIAFEAALLITDTGSIASDAFFILLAFIFFAAGLIWRLAPALRTRLSDTLYPVLISLCYYIQSIDSIEPKHLFYRLLITVMLTALITLSAAEKKTGAFTKLFRSALPISSIAMLAEASILISEACSPKTYTQDMQITMLSMMLLSFAAAFVFARVERIHTALSDILFPIVLFVCGYSMANFGSPECMRIACGAFMLAAVLMMITGSGSGAVAKGMRWLLIIPVTHMVFAAGASLENVIPALKDPDNEMLFCCCLLILFGLIFRYSQYIGANIRTAVSDIGFVVTPILMGLSLTYERAAAMLLLDSLLILTVIFEKKYQMRGSVLFMRLLLPLTLVISSFSIYAAVERISEQHVYPEGLILLVMLAALFALFDRVNKLRTPLSDLLIPAATTYAMFCFCGIKYEELAITLLYVTALCAMLIIQGLERDKGGHLIIHRIASSIPLLILKITLSDLFSLNMDTNTADDISLILTVLIGGTAAALFTWFAKTRREDTGRLYVPMQYSWTAMTGLILLFGSLDSSCGLFVLIASAALSILMYLLCSKQRNNLLSAIFVISFLICSFSIPLSIKTENGHTPYIAVCAVILSAVLWSGRLLFKERLIDRTDGFRIDLAAFGSAVIPYYLLNNISSDISLRAGQGLASLALILTAGFFANLMRRGNPVKTNRTLMSLASACLCCLVYTRPFLISDDPVINAKINLLPLLLFGVIVRRIWSEDKKPADRLSFGVNLAALIFLLLDALMHQSIGNTIFVLCVTLAIMLVSFAKRNGRWFAISAAAFIGLTMYITHEFIGSAQWWVYLLAAGIILISVAAANEYIKSSGKSLKDITSRFLKRWKK